MKYAQWITGPKSSVEKDATPVPLTFRKKFEAGTGIRSAFLYITAMGIYTVSLNSKRAEDFYYGPFFTDYRHRLQYQTLDVLPLLSQQNELTVAVGAGWACGRYGTQNKPCRYEKQPSLLAELCVTYQDGTVMWISTDSSWEVTVEGRYRSADWYDGETYDASVDYGAITWNQAAYARLRCKPEILPQYGAMVRIIGEYQPVNHFSTPSGNFIYDFGQNIAGVISAEIEGQRGQTVTFRHAEELYKGDLFTLPLGSALQTAVYVCGGGQETYSPRLTGMGFRYVSVSGIAPEKIKLTALALSSDCAENGRFSCSDTNLESLNRVLIQTARSNMLDIPTDGPAGDERLARPEIAASAAPAMAFLFNTGDFFGKWLTDLSTEQNRLGALPECIPSAGSLHDRPGDAAVTVPWAEYLARGDKKLLSHQYPAIRKYLKNAAAYVWLGGISSPKYIHSFSMGQGDWGAPAKTSRQWKKSASLIATANLANSCRIASKIAALLGEEEDAREYGELFTRISEAFCTHFTDGNGKLINETQAGYALPLCYGMVSGDIAARMTENLARLTEEDEVITCGPAHASLVLFALADNGRTQEAYRLLLEYSRPSWLYELEKGATTLWESFDTVTPEGHFNLNPAKQLSYSPSEIDKMIYLNTDCGKTSFNSPAALSVGDFLYRRVAGLEPLEGAYQRILIRPVPGAGISSASASVESPFGTVSVSWKVEHAFFVLNASLPEGVSAEVQLPDGTETELASGSHELRIIAPWRKYRISENENREIAAMIKEGLKQKDGYCPCRLAKTPENKCMCLEFRNQLKDPEFEGLCHCKLYKKTYEDYQLQRTDR